MARVHLYTTAWCGDCVRAKVLLEQRGIPFEEIRIDEEPNFRAHLEELTGGWTVPQVVIDGEPRGGYAELVVLDRAGELADFASSAA
jgi:glutaredoxin 3